MGFAPYELWPLVLPGPLLLFLFWGGATPRQAFAQGWSYGLGLLGGGVFWLHVSIDQFGNIGTPLAMLVTLVFIALMALYYGLCGWLVARMGGTSIPLGWLLFALTWLLSEWLRGWFLTGFPWLGLGYSQVSAPLAGYAPVLGSYGVGFLLVLSLGLLGHGLREHRWRPVVAALLIWLAGWLLQQLDWTRPSGEPLSVAVIQGNISQAQKWRREQLQPTLDLYAGLTRGQWDKDLILWPETAVPAFAHQMERQLLTPLEREAEAAGSALLLGIPVWEQGQKRYYNSLLTLGDGRDRYDKRHLVAFGEFIPLQGWLAPLLGWMNVPMSDFSAGESERPLIRFGRYLAGVSICYEDAFGDEVIQALPEAQFLVNASNDAWFGDSLAPAQHLQIARMRALESGRYLLRTTNTGISAIIGPKGELLRRSPSFVVHVLEGEIRPMSGVTPFALAGNAPLLGGGALLLLLFWRRRPRH